jgi:tRNA A-37 threonylcarbamoyl transferase component Bud32
MPEGEIEIAYCHACGASMDVTLVAPFSNVECPACAKHTRVKREFGPYTLLRRHAIGGMSVVFIAQDNTLNREVVVKILNEEYGGDEKRIGAFEEEARITASFSHPHVVRVFTTGRAFGRFYIAMELVPGGHYEHHIRERGSIPEAEVLPLAIQVAAGLKAAHAAGLIHRDVKPGNILLDASGNAKLVDFGLALVTKGGTATATEIWATPYYVPPETIEGLAEDFRSDIYAFGATFYHALAGKPPCNEESMDTNRLRDAKKKIAPLAKVAPWVGAETCAVIDRAMAHDPQQRFRSYEDLIAALEGARQRLAARPADGGKRSAGKGERSPLSERIALAAASLMVVGALVFGTWWVMQPPEVPAPPPDAVKIEPETKPEPAGDGGAKAGAIYREAGEALVAGDYDRAAKLFAQVRDEPGVLEPTGSWAACEAIVASYLNGRAADARRESVAAIRHIEVAKGLEEAVRGELLQAASKARGLKGMSRPAGAPTPSGASLLAALVSGLKNWEHGMPEAARPHFDAVLAADPAGADAWVAPYRKILESYLADAAVLKSAEPAGPPDTAAACLARIDELEALKVTLKTRGRARFNVRSWQSDLERHARLLGRKPAAEPTPPPPVRDPVAGVREATSACRFADATELMKSPDFIVASGKEKTLALLQLTEAAAAFLGDLEDDLKAVPEGIALMTRDQTKLDRVTAVRSGGVKATDAAGEARDLGWGEISPDSLIELHRSLVKDEASELERLRRHEQAIAFDLLAGNPQRGKEAADVLAARYPAFKRRWDQVQPALK